MSLFGPKTVLGIDLGTSGVKIAELSHSGGRFDLKNYGLLDFTDKDETALKLGDQVLANGIKELLSKTKVSTKNVIVSISSFLTFATVIELPYLSEKDLEKAIPFEARKYIPVPLEELVLDWSIVNVKEISEHQNSNVPQSKYPNVEIFLAAVPKAEAEKYKNIFALAGLNLRALELENIALVRSLIGEDLSPMAIINLGGRSTSIFIIDKGFERITRNYELGGFELTKTLSRALGVSFERAEQMKKTEGLKATSSDLADALTPLVDLIVFETQKIISNYEEAKKVKINKIILSGRQANMPGFREYFNQKLKVATVIGDPFRNVSFNRLLGPTLKDLGPALSVAIGLAMRKI